MDKHSRQLSLTLTGMALSLLSLGPALPLNAQSASTATQTPSPTLSTPSTAPTAPTTSTPKAAPNNASNPTNPNTAQKPMATHLVLVLGERKVYAYQNNKILASYPVAIGKKGWETPQGSFKVIQMVENPVWENPWNGKKVPASLDGPIGVRWIGFWTDGKNTIGFHGTPKRQEKLLGQAVSHGCVRMRNPDVIALYEMVRTGIPVSVVQKK